MLNSASLHQGLHCMLRQNQSLVKEIQYFWETDSSIYTMDHPDIIVYSLIENLIGLKRVDYCICPNQKTSHYQKTSHRVLYGFLSLRSSGFRVMVNG